MIRTLSKRRTGFTLVELLVVIALIILLAALATGFAYSGALGSQSVVTSADGASNWCSISKNRAKRDGAPRGVRFYINPATAPLPENQGMVTEAQYIEMPDLWVPNPNQELNATNTLPLVGARIVFVNTVDASGQINGREVHFVGSPADLSEFDQRIRNEDQLLLPELGAPLRIIGITNAGPQASTQLGNPAITVPSRRLELAGFTPTGSNPAGFVREMHLGAMNVPPPVTPATAPNPGTYVTFKFGFQPAPRVMLGDDTLKLKAGTVIDYRFPGATGYRDGSTPPGPYNPSTTIGVTNFTDSSLNQYFDILFAPSGQVLNAPAGVICLWVRDSTKLQSLGNHPRLDLLGNVDTQAQYNEAGQQILIAIYARTGAISAQQVEQPPLAPSANYDPYRFVKDGINAGY